MRDQAGFDVPRDLLGRAARIDQHMQFVDAAQRVEDGAHGHHIFELADNIFDLFGRNIAARGRGSSSV